MEFTNKTAVIAGPVVDIKEYERPIGFNYIGRGKGRRSKGTTSPEPTDGKSSAISSLRRSKARIRTLVAANVGAYSYGKGKKCRSLMLTLTFAENITDLTQAHYEYMLFIQRLNERCFGTGLSLLKYVVVVEFQKRGAIHYHAVLFNLPYMGDVHADIKETWRNGLVFISNIRSPLSAATYLTKYLTKAADDGRLWGRKRYFVSRKLIQPLIVKDSGTVSKVQDELSEEYCVYVGEYQSERAGKVTIKRYVLPEDSNFGEQAAAIVADAPEKTFILFLRDGRDKVPAPTGVQEKETDRLLALPLNN